MQLSNNQNGKYCIGFKSPKSHILVGTKQLGNRNWEMKIGNLKQDKKSEKLQKMTNVIAESKHTFLMCDIKWCDRQKA